MTIAIIHAAIVAAAPAAVAMPPFWREPAWEWWEEENVPLTDALRREYEDRFRSCTLNAGRQEETERIITRMMKNRSRYESVAEKTSVPWYVIALLHDMECDGNFDCHLHNGDPLTRRTVNVPKGRPATGSPPFTWEESAVDALHVDAFDVWKDWSVAGTLFKIEAYNGWGYRGKGVATPYLWGGSQIYTAGKYVRDGVFDPDAVSAQIGAAVVLRRMVDQALIDFPPHNAPPAPASTGAQ